MKRIFPVILIIIILSGCAVSNTNPILPENSSDTATSRLQSTESTASAESVETIAPVQTLSSIPETSFPAIETETEQTSGETSMKENIINPYHPIVFVYKNYKGDFSSVIFGGSKDGKWYNLDDFNLPEDDSQCKNFYLALAKGDEVYNLYSKDKFLSSITGNSLRIHYAESSGTHYITQKFDSLHSEEDSIIGVNCDWNALPRIPEIIEPGAYSIDLDNDGEDEVLKITENPDSKTKDITNIQAFVEKNGDRILELDFNLEDPYTVKYNIFFLDLDGDGIMEMVETTIGHNISISVYQLRDSKFSKVVHFYVGD